MTPPLPSAAAFITKSSVNLPDSRALTTSSVEYGDRLSLASAGFPAASVPGRMADAATSSINTRILEDKTRAVGEDLRGGSELKTHC